MNSGQKKIVYKDQSALDLCFNLTRGQIDLDQFSLVETGEQTIPEIDLQVTARIIGASHLVQIRVGEQLLLSEILACTPVDVPDGGHMIYVGPLRNFLQGVNFTVSNSQFTYGFQTKVVDLTERYVTEQIDGLTAVVQAVVGKTDGREIGLEFEFPDQGSSSRFKPATLVWVQISERPWRITMQTAHIYPNEDQVVFTRSYLVLKNGKEDTI